MEKKYKVNDDLTLEMDGKTYRLTKNKLNNCDHCPFHKMLGCGELCDATYYKAAETPSFDYSDAIFVEVTENKETTMEEKEPKNEPNYKALYEQEHKKYGDAVERMKSWMNGEHPECFSEARKAAEFVFPELRESEDEKIRKELIQFVKDYPNLPNGKYCRTDFFNWLEKQGGQKQTPCENCNHAMLNCGNFPCEEKKGYNGEQKPTDNVEPKFKVGDWVVKGDTIAQILDIQEQYYVGLDINGKDFTSSRFLSDDKIHLWTINDAKDGDVLANKNGAIFINAGNTGEDRATLDCYCYLSVQNEFYIEEHKTGSWFYKTEIHPATKEQRDLLFTKMKEAGYEWDAKEKELKKIEQKPEIKDDVLSRFAFYQYDDDTIYLSSLFVRESDRGRGYGSKVLKAAEEVAKTFGISKIRLKVERNTWMEKWYEKNGYEYLSSEGKYNWLENRVIDIKPNKIEQKPTDKVEPKFKVGDVIRLKGGAAEYTIRRVTNTTYYTDGWSYDIERCEEDYELVEQKSTWSEEDERIFVSIIEDVMPCGECPDYPTDEEREYFYEGNRKVDWLKSLKDRMTWRPTEEQMEALSDAVKLYKSTHFDSHHYKIETLYNDLKKL